MPAHILCDYVLKNLRPYLRDPVVVTVDLGYARKGAISRPALTLRLHLSKNDGLPTSEG